MKHAISWFEIPVKQFDATRKFYESVMDTQLVDFPMEGSDDKMAMFPVDMENGAVGGAICQSEGYEPSANGSVIYLNGGDDLATPLSRVEAAGGQVVLPKTSIGENGFIAHFLDPEGNRVALHSPQ